MPTRNQFVCPAWPRPRQAPNRPRRCRHALAMPMASVFYVICVHCTACVSRTRTHIMTHTHTNMMTETRIAHRLNACTHITLALTPRWYSHNACTHIMFAYTSRFTHHVCIHVMLVHTSCLRAHRACAHIMLALTSCFLKHASDFHTHTRIALKHARTHTDTNDRYDHRPFLCAWCIAIEMLI